MGGRFSIVDHGIAASVFGRGRREGNHAALIPYANGILKQNGFNTLALNVTDAEVDGYIF